MTVRKKSTKKAPAKRSGSRKTPTARKAPPAKRAGTKKTPTARKAPPAKRAGTKKTPAPPKAHAPLVPIEFFGPFDAKKAGCGLDRVERLLGEALRRAKQAWAWTPPPPLRVTFHKSGKALGYTYHARPEGVLHSWLSFSFDLLRLYHDATVLRVMVHELCHYHRHHSFPTNPPRQAHDALFCRELKRVDPVVASDPRQCAKISDEAAPGTPLAALDGEVHVDLLARSYGALTWRPRKGKSESVRSVGRVLAFFRRFPPRDLGSLRVFLHRRKDPNPPREMTGRQFAELYWFRHEGKKRSLAEVLGLPKIPHAPPTKATTLAPSMPRPPSPGPGGALPIGVRANPAPSPRPPAPPVLPAPPPPVSAFARLTRFLGGR